MAYETVEVNGIKLDVEFDYFPFDTPTTFSGGILPQRLG